MYLVVANERFIDAIFRFTFVRAVGSMVGGLLGCRERTWLGWDSGDHDTVGGIA